MTTEPRILPVTDLEASSEQSELLDRMRRDGEVLGIFRTMANHPDLARRWMVFGNHVLTKSTLDPIARELAILRTGWLCNCEYEFGQHVLIALRAGVTQAEVERVQVESLDSGWEEPVVCVLAAADDLYENKMISDETWKRLSEHYTDQQIMDLVFAVGQYTLVSMALKSFGVALEDGAPRFVNKPRED